MRMLFGLLIRVFVSGPLLLIGTGALWASDKANKFSAAVQGVSLSGTKP